MTVDTDGIESTLDDVRELEDDAALRELRTASRDLRRLRNDACTPTDRESLDRLATRLTQRYLEVRERTAYDGGDGAAVNLDEENAP